MWVSQISVFIFLICFIITIIRMKKDIKELKTKFKYLELEKKYDNKTK